MDFSSNKLVILLWTVIAALIAGVAVGGFILVHRADELTHTNAVLNGNNDSLNRQVKQLRAARTPQPDPLPEATANGQTPTPTPKTR